MKIREWKYHRFDLVLTIIHFFFSFFLFFFFSFFSFFFWIYSKQKENIIVWLYSPQHRRAPARGSACRTSACHRAPWSASRTWRGRPTRSWWRWPTRARSAACGWSTRCEARRSTLRFANRARRWPRWRGRATHACWSWLRVPPSVISLIDNWWVQQQKKKEKERKKKKRKKKKKERTIWKWRISFLLFFETSFCSCKHFLISIFFVFFFFFLKKKKQIETNCKSNYKYLWSIHSWWWCQCSVEIFSRFHHFINCNSRIRCSFIDQFTKYKVIHFNLFFFFFLKKKKKIEIEKKKNSWFF